MAAGVYVNNAENVLGSDQTKSLLDPFEYYNNYNEHGNWVFSAFIIGCPIAMLVGVLANTLAFVVLVRGRLWLKHEGYVYMAATFCVNVSILLFRTSSFWITSSKEWLQYYPANTSTFMCKVWYFLRSIFLASGWLCVALLYNVYLRQNLIRGSSYSCPVLAAKYCTLLASKIIVGVIFGVLFVLGVPSLVMLDLHPDGSCYSSLRIAYYLALLA